jgi:hypothetical protein
MHCPSCRSDRIYGPHFGCAIVPSLQQAFHVYGRSWATFDARDDGWVVVRKAEPVAVG